MDKKVGFAGLGIMGFYMAKHLQEAGINLTVYNRTPDKAQELGNLGAAVAKTPAELAGACNIIFLMLGNDNAVEEVCFGPNGIVKGLKGSLTLINSGTSDPKFNIGLYDRLKSHGIEFLDVPVTGSGVHAKAGTLTFMCGGNKEAFTECIPLFEAMGKEAFHMGGIGSGSYTKLANNTMLAINLCAFAEAVTLVAKAGVDPELFVKVSSGGGGSNGMAQAKVSKVVKRDFSPAFKVKSLVKDLKLITACAEDLKLVTPVTALARELVNISESKGYTDEDVCSLVKCYEEWSKTEVQKV